MGCGISDQSGHDLELAKEIWQKMEYQQSPNIPPEKIVFPHSEWKTVRLFLGCTFKDFRNERELLHSKNKTEEPSDPDHVVLFLDTIEQCFQDNQCPYYLSLLGECAGFVPPLDTLDEETAESFGVAKGLSLLEMQTLTAVYKKDNPNALFMVRDPRFLSEIPFHKVQFIEDEPGRKRIAYLKQKLSQKIPVTEFFKKRIEQQYPLVSPAKGNFLEKTAELHRLCASKNSNVESGQLGQVAEKVYNILMEKDGSRMIMITGDYGAGKTSVLSRVIMRLLSGDQEQQSTATSNKRTKYKDKPCKIFYHFCSNVVGGKSGQRMLLRLLKSVFNVDIKDNSLVSDRLEELQVTVKARLLNPNCIPIIFVFDDIDLLDSTNPLIWLPADLPSQIRVVISVTTTNTVVPKQLNHHYQDCLTEIKLSHMSKTEARDDPKGTEVTNSTSRRHQVCDDLINAQPPSTRGIQSGIPAGRPGARRSLTSGLIGKRRATVHDIEAVIKSEGHKQLKHPEFTAPKCKTLSTLLRFGSPLELARALVYQNCLSCSEVELYQYEADSHGHLLVATLCFLQVSNSGLREIELRHLLADERRLLPDTIKRRHSRFGFHYDDSDPNQKQVAPLRWRQTWVRLSHHLMEFGEPGENRFQIANSSIRQAVQKKYLSTKQSTAWWHGKLARFFQIDKPILRDRKVEELLCHLIALGRRDKLINLLADWEVIDHFFNNNSVHELINVWEQKNINRNDLLEWVESDDQNEIPMVMASYTITLENLQNVEQQSEDIKSQKALCYERLAFWTVWQKKLNKDQSSLKKASTLASQAKDVYHELKDYIGQAHAFMIRAQCEKSDEKINEALSKAEERIVKAEGAFSPKLFEVYGLRMKLQSAKAREYSDKAKNLCQSLYQNGDKEKYSLVLAMIEEINV